MIAFLRGVSPLLERGELTHLPRRPIKIERARKRHTAYVILGHMRTNQAIIQIVFEPDPPAAMQVPA